MAEELVLTDPVIVPEVVTNKYHIVNIYLDTEGTLGLNGEKGIIRLNLVDNNGVPFYHQYTGKTAIDFIKYINTANFTVNSMQKRILQRLSTDGVLPGTVTGTPDPPVAADPVQEEA